MSLNSEDTIGGHYKIIHQLGKGGFGWTYLARETRLPDNPWRVVKEIEPQSTNLSFLQDLEERFKREVNALHRLGKHDQIPELFAFFQENGNFYLVQQYIEGHDLSKELTGRRHFSEDEVIELLQDILEVLQVVHEQNIIHRDIKPSNLIRRSQDRKIVLIDFGAVKEISALGPQGATRVIGTQGYLPPEQSFGRPVPSSDIYAVGMVGIQALTALNPSSQIHTDGNGEILWQPWGEQASPRLAGILNKMVRSDYQQRYQSVAEVLQDLQALSGQSPTKPPALSGQNPTLSPTRYSIWAVVRQAALTGSGSWLLALALFSFIGTVWISTAFWVLILGSLVFLFFKRAAPIFEKIRLLIISMIPTVLTCLFLPKNLENWISTAALLPQIITFSYLVILSFSFAFLLMLLERAFDSYFGNRFF